MSIVRMRKLVRRQLRLHMFGKTIELGSPAAIIFWVFIVIFIIGTYWMYGPGGDSRGGQASASGRKVSNVVAVVDGKQLSRAQFEGMLAYAGRVQSPDIAQMRQIKTSILDGMIENQLLREAARAEGVRVTNADISAEKSEMIEEIISTHYSDRRTLRRELERKNMSLEAFKEELREERLPADDDIRTSLMFEKLQKQVEDAVVMTDQQLKDSFAKVTAQHIFVDPKRIIAEANPPKPAEDGQAAATPEKPQMTDAQAEQQGRDLLAKLKQRAESGEDFARLAVQNSHDPNAELGTFGPGEPIQSYGEPIPEIDKAVATLKPGQLTDVVKSKFGLHLVKVVSRASVPADFDKKKEQYREEKLDETRAQAWQTYQDELRDKARIEIVDPELKAYKLLEEDPAKNAGQAAELLSQAMQTDSYNTSAPYELANLLEQGGKNDEAIKVLTDLAASEGGARSAQVHLRLGMLLKNAKRNDEAIASLKSASEWAQGFDWQNMFAHMQLKGLFEELKQPEEAAREQQWLDDFNASQSNAPQVIQVPPTGGGQ